MLFSFNAVLFTEVFYHIRFHTSSRVFKLFYKLFHAIRKAAYVLLHVLCPIGLRREQLGGREYQTLERCAYIGRLLSALLCRFRYLFL